MAQLAANVLEYAGKTVDHLAFDDAKPVGDTLLTQTLVKQRQSGALITGISKLVQRFIVELLTEKGSLDYLPERGTFFMTALRLGLIRTSQELFATFNAAIQDVRLNLQLEEKDTDPIDEKYRNAELISTSLLGDTATLVVRITSQAGDARVVTYPLRISAI